MGVFVCMIAFLSLTLLCEAHTRKIDIVMMLMLVVVVVVMVVVMVVW